MIKSAVYRFGSVVVTVSALMCVGAKGSGCSVESSDDGTSSTWTVGAVPVSSAPRAMSCAFLTGDNCWKRLVAKAEACSAGVRVDASFDSARKVCSTATAARLETGGPISTPAVGSVSIVATDWRILDEHGAECATGKILGTGHTLVDVQGEVAEFESTSLLEYRLTCPDGSTYSNEAALNATAGDAGSDGVCPSFGTDYLAHRTPGVLFSCDGSDKDCRIDLWGGATGETRIATCGW